MSIEIFLSLASKATVLRTALDRAFHQANPLESPIDASSVNATTDPTLFKTCMTMEQLIVKLKWEGTKLQKDPPEDVFELVELVYDHLDQLRPVLEEYAKEGFNQRERVIKYLRDLGVEQNAADLCADCFSQLRLSGSIPTERFRKLDLDMQNKFLAVQEALGNTLLKLKNLF